MCDEYFKKCRYCTNYVQGKCVALGELINTSGVIEELVNNCVENTDYRIRVEEEIPNKSVDLSRNIRRIIEGNSRVGKDKLNIIENLIYELLNKEYSNLLESVVDLVCASAFELSRGKIDGVEVNTEFLCKDWR